MTEMRSQLKEISGQVTKVSVVQKGPRAPRQDQGLDCSLTEDDVLSGLPIMDMASWEVFEKLKNDKKFKCGLARKMKESLEGIGSVGEYVRRALSMVLSNALASEFNWGGRAKKPFKNQLIVKMINWLLKKHCKFPRKKDDVKEVVASWLRLAKQRLGGDNFQKYYCNELFGHPVNVFAKPTRVEGDVWERDMEPLPTLRDFFHVIPTGTDITTFVLERGEKDDAPVQPYVLAKGTHKKIDSIALVLGDSEFIHLPRSTMPLRAVDLLVKANYVLGTHFYLGWKYVFRFLVANVYKMKLENPRHLSFTDQFKTIMAAGK